MTARNDETSSTHGCIECGVYVADPRRHSTWHKRQRFQVTDLGRAIQALREKLRRMTKVD